MGHRMFAYGRRFSRSRTSVALLVILGVASPERLISQEHEHPAAEKFAERAREAQAAPLFSHEEPLAFTLRTNIKWLRDARSDEEEVEGTVTLEGSGGADLVLPVKVRTRGIFRRDRRNCNFPPLRLNFPKSEMEGTVFEGQDKLKLVTPCHDSRDSYQDYVYYEYLIYKAYQLLTPISFRVRLVEITYEDIAGDYDTRTKYGFLIEDGDEMAARNSGLLEDVDEFNPGLTNAEYSAMMSLFQYLIGNTDWSSFQFHNVELVHAESGQYYTVPYDFDFAGAVGARYAVPDGSLPIRDVRDRLFRGFCFPLIRQRARWADFFSERRQAIADLYTGFGFLAGDDRGDAVKYFDEFFEILGDDRKYQREIIEQCLG